IASRDLRPFPTRRSSDLGLSIAGSELKRMWSHTYSVGGRFTHGTCLRPAFHADSIRQRRPGSHVQPYSTMTNFSRGNRSKTPWRSEEHTSELQSPYDLVC